MANKQHLSILERGIEDWNKWREEQPAITPDLNNAKLNRARLNGVDLNRARLNGADLYIADLNNANLRDARFKGANLSRTNLNNADLRGANLSGAKLDYATLNGADLSRANLTDTNLSDTTLNGADLSDAIIGSTVFGNLDLSRIKGLETVKHFYPSTIGIDTIYASQGKIAEAFLRRAGVQESFLEVMAALTNQPVEYYTCFISYSSKNQDFAERLYADLQSNGVRCWYAPEDMKTGDRIRHRIDTSIRLYDKLLLILSDASVASQWVEHEVETAIGKEMGSSANVLFPIRLDDTVMRSEVGWASHIRLTRHITDFSLWKDHDAYQKAFERLLRDLKADTTQES